MFNQYLSGMATIFMLHRVYPVENSTLSLNENLRISPDFLEKFICGAKSKGYSFISLDTLHNALLNNKKIPKSIVITLDDGYMDNYTYAYPIFKKHNIPFAIYITTSFPDNTAVLWWYTLEDIVIKNESITLSDGQYFECKTLNQKIETFMRIRKQIIALPKEGFIEALQVLFVPNIIDWHSKVAELAMPWAYIKKISSEPLGTIGAHTVNHFASNRLSKEELIDEVMGSKHILESHINKRVEHFCYPFGGPNEVGEKEFSVVNELGFKTSTTTRYGCIFPNHKNHLVALPRVMLNSDFSLSRPELTAVKRFLTRLATASGSDLKRLKANY